MKPFALGDRVVAIDSSGRILRRMQVFKIGLRWFETSDGSKWRATGFGTATRVPEAIEAPTLRHARKTDELLDAAFGAREELERYHVPVTGVEARRLVKASEMLKGNK